MVIILTKIFSPLEMLPFLSHKCALDSSINYKFVKKIYKCAFFTYYYFLR